MEPQHKVSNDYVDKLDFNETLSDFASIIQEHGGPAVGYKFAKAFPDEALAVYQHMQMPKQQVAALFKP